LLAVGDSNQTNDVVMALLLGGSEQELFAQTRQERTESETRRSASALNGTNDLTPSTHSFDQATQPGIRVRAATSPKLDRRIQVP
jgi:hypothetical protein